jgi:hypothetical protein
MKTLATMACVATLVLGMGTTSQAGYDTNKFDLKAQVENGGWVVAWSDDITESDALRGVVAGGVSVYSANPAPFIAWVDQLATRAISSLSRNASSRFTSQMRADAKRAATDIIKAAVQGKSAREVLKRYDTVDFKAGAIRYSGTNWIKVFGRKQTISKTWGLKIYVAYRLR